MKLLCGFVILAVLATVLADCGCLRCGKNLRVVSPPNAPVTVICRGESCICPKPIPYRVEIPRPVCHKPCPQRSYGYEIQTVRYVKPQDPQLCRYGFQVQVPKVCKTPCHYYMGLVAKTDRVVIPARDECVPPPPTCGPIIEYFAPREEHMDEEYRCRSN